jgi:DNA-binding CsgD family transcriptional regulator
MGATPRQWDQDEVAAMLRLANRLHARRDGPVSGAGGSGSASGSASDAPRLTVLLDGTRTLVKSSLALLVVGEVRPVGDVSTRVQWADILCTHVTGGGKAAGRLLAATAGRDPAVADPAVHKLLRKAMRRNDAAGSPPVTLTRRELLDDDHWYDSGHVKEVRRPAGVDDSLYSARVLPCGAVACLCLCRPWGERRHFDDRDARTLDLIHAECGWAYLHELPSKEIKALSLSPREREVLWKLLSGRGEKEIATDMCLSQNTVHHYVKAIYKRLGVSSRVELLARWLGKELDP